MISRRAAAFDSSGIRRVFDLIRSLPDPINLSIGQPDFPMPEAACQAACEATQAGRNGYTATQGLPELRERLEAEVRVACGQPERTLCITSGTSGALVLALMALIDPRFTDMDRLAAEELIADAMAIREAQQRMAASEAR